jgi:AcrR family transcriptional regulator
MLKVEPINQNSKRSISLLIETMLDLLKTTKLNDISISHLTKTAGLARNTFYAHFETKESLISYYIYTLFDLKVNTILGEVGDGYNNFDLLYFEMWHENKELLRLLEENNLLYLLSNFGQYIDMFCEQYSLYDDCNISELSAPYINTVYANALGSIIIKWLKLDFAHSPKELSVIFNEIIK